MAAANNSSRKARTSLEPNAVLLVTDQYATSKEDDVSTMNRQVVQILIGAGRKVYCLVLEDTEEDRKCAEADGVELILPTPIEGDTRKPCLDWLTFDHRIRYPRLPQDIGWIVGHADVTSRAAATIMDERFPQANLSLVTQTIPEDTEKYKKKEKAMGIGKKEDSIRQDAEKAKTLFSVGHRTHDHFINSIRAIPKDKRPVHKLFLPEPSKIFQETTVEYVESREKVVLLISRVKEVGKLKGLDFVAKSLARVAERSHERIQLRIRGVSEEEYLASMNILRTSINSGKLIPTLLPHGTQEDICRDMQQAHLVLMPSRTEPFGLVGLEAMAAGVPVLISDQSGLATLVKEVIPEFHHSVLAITGDDSIDVRQWADQIEKVLRLSEAEFSRSAALKQRLLESRYWEESHQSFLEACGGSGPDAQQPGQAETGERETDPTGETDESREAIKTDMSGLCQLWFMYKCGKLNDLLAGSLIREETLQQLCAESISVKTNINTEDFRKALVYLLTSSSVEGQPIPRLPQEYPLYQSPTHTTTSVLDVLHLDGTNLTRSSGKQQELHIPPATQTNDDSQDHLGTELGKLKITAHINEFTDDQQTTEAHNTTDVPEVISELVSLDIRELEQLMGKPRKRTSSMSSQTSGYQTGTPGSGPSRPYSPTGEVETQTKLGTLLAELNTPAVMVDKAQQFDLYCQIGDLYRTELHNLQSALQYYQNMLQCSQELSEDTKEAKAYNRLGITQVLHRDVGTSQGLGEEGLGEIGLQQTWTGPLCHGEHEKSLESHKKDLKMSQESGDKTGQITAHQNIASSYKALGKLDLARSQYQSALAIAMETGNKTEQMDTYCKLGDLHREQLHEPQESHKYYTEMLALAKDLGRKDRERLAYNRLGHAPYAFSWAGQITAHQNIATSYEELGKLDLARSHYQSAMTIAMETGNKTQQMDIYLQLGDLHGEQLHEPQESHKYYTEMLALARDLGRKDREGLAYNRLGRAHYDMGEFEESLEWEKKGLKMRQESGDKTEQITAHQNIADSYKALGKLDLVRSHYQSAMTIAMETGNKNQEMDIYCELADLHREQLHEPQESHKYYTEMLALARDLGRKDREGDAYNKLGLAHYDMGEHEDSLEWNKKYLKMRQESGDKTEQITAHQNIADSYKALGKLDLARSHYQSAMTVAMETGNKTKQMDIYCKLGDLHREQLHEPQESHRYYTEMLALARDLGRKDWEGLAYNRLGWAHYDMGEHKKSLEWYKRYLKMSQERGDKTEQITAHHNIAGSYEALGKLDLARSHYQSAMTIAMETGNKTGQMDIYLQLGDLHREQLHEPQESHKYYTEMLALARDLGRKDREGDAYNKLGLAHYDMGEHEDSLEWNKKYLKMRQESGDKTEQITAHQNIADSYKALGKLDLARSHYQSAMTVAMETGNKTKQMDIYCKLGDLHREQLHEPQESHRYYTEMLALARDLGRKDWEGLAYNRLGWAHYDMGEHKKSLEWYKRYLKMSQERGDKTEQITAHHNIAGSYEALGKLDLARSHYQSAMTIAMETGNKTGQMDIYLQLGDLHREQLHEPQESHKYYTEMLALARDLGRKDREGDAYNKLGLAHYDMGEHEDSLEWNKKYLKMRQESGDKTEQITAHQNIADSYKALGKLDLARSHYQSAMTVAMETGNKTKQMDIYCKLGDLHREQLHEPQESHRYYTEMLALARDLGRKDWEGLAYNRLGWAHYDMGEHKKSLEWYKRYLKMSQERGDKTEQITAHHNIAGSYEALGKLDLARSHYQSAMTIAMETGNKTQQMDIYLQLGDLHREQLHEPQESHKYYTEMLALARDLGRKDWEGLAYNRLGRAHYAMGEHEESLVWAKKDLKMRQESGDKTEQMDIYCKLGDLHREQLHEPQESHKYYTEMLALARDLGRKDWEGLAYNRLGHAHYDMGEYEQSLEWSKKHLKMRQESGDKTGQITAHKNIADSYKALGKLDLARSHYQSEMTIAMETGKKTEQMDIYLQLGDLHREQLHEPQESHKYYTEMLALARDLGRKDRESQAYNRLGRAHYDMGEHEESLEWHKNHLRMRQESGDKTGQITAHKNIADSYKALGKPDLARSHYQSEMTIAMETGKKTEQMDIYLQLGDLHREQLHEPQESHKYYTEMLALARDLGRKDRESQAYNRLGRAHYDMGEHEESLEWDKKCLKMSQETGDKTGQIIGYQNIADSYKALGKLDLARSHYQSAMTIAMETGNKQKQEVIAKKLANL
ncbi:hypothetical protein Bbelb_022480 [Branchiostoma belcheri]|nr:hypothetical protein Bbelb_022480 [Branchiostoma belcheri]